MVVTCHIELEGNPHAIFFAGQVILGKVTLTANKAKQVEAVNLKINGCAKTQWEEHNTMKRKYATYSGKVDYVDTVTSLMAPNTSDEAVIIQPGIHTFSFACHVPANCPSSLELTHGSIRYTLKVTLERSWKFDQTFTKAFTIIRITDLNYDSPLLKLPSSNNISQKLCCGPCQRKQLQVICQLPQTVFVPGQKIPINILIPDNTGSQSITEISLSLIMVVNLQSTQPFKRSKLETKIISNVKDEPVVGNKSLNYLLPVPATPPTCSTICSIIQISYHVEVQAKVEGILCKTKFLSVPVTIGNVPLCPSKTIVQQQPSLLQSRNYGNDATKCNEGCAVTVVESGVGSVYYNENREPWSTLGITTTPTYKEAPHLLQVTLAEDEEHDYGDTTFAPKYPVFDITNLNSIENSSNDVVDGHSTVPTPKDYVKTTWL